MISGDIYDWHNPHNDECPQNTGDIEKNCNCVQKLKRTKKSDLINRAFVKKMLLQETNDRQSLRIFTCVRPSTLDEISAIVKREIIRRAEDPPRKGKTL